MSASLYSTTFHETAPNIHYSPRLSCFQETFESRTVNAQHCLVVTSSYLFGHHALLHVSERRSWSSNAQEKRSFSIQIPRCQLREWEQSSSVLPISENPQVKFTGAEHILATTIAHTIALGSTNVQNGIGCAIEKVNETYESLTHQLENRINMVKREISASVKAQNGLSEKTKSILSQLHRTGDAFIKQSRRFIGAVAAIGAGAGLILGDPIKDDACTTLSIFNMCNDNSQLSPDFEALMDTNSKLFWLCSASRQRMTITSSYLVMKSKNHNTMSSKSRTM